MSTWLTALQDLQHSATAALLVTVATSQGSTPRASGARMVFTAAQQFDTIGGGHLEWRAAQIARAMLSDQNGALSSQRRLERIALGPSLGQCCGGVVWLAFERIDVAALLPDDNDWLPQLQSYWQQGIDVWRVLALDALTPVMLLSTDTAHALPPLPPSIPSPQEQGTHIVSNQQGSRWLFDRCRAQRPQVVLFGAGHVGAALVRVLATLPCRVIWVDEREDMFPHDLPSQISIEATDVPNAVVDQAEPGAYFLVMTHSHALDQQLSERILKRADIGWFGLIGSITKRRQFEHRLQERGITPQQLNKMICPIGIPGIYGKEPASIAIAVVAQLLQLWELQTRPAARRSEVNRLTETLDGRP